MAPPSLMLTPVTTPLFDFRSGEGISTSLVERGDMAKDCDDALPTGVLMWFAGAGGGERCESVLIRVLCSGIQDGEHRGGSSSVTAAVRLPPRFPRREAIGAARATAGVVADFKNGVLSSGLPPPSLQRPLTATTATSLSLCTTGRRSPTLPRLPLRFVVGAVRLPRPAETLLPDAAPAVHNTDLLFAVSAEEEAPAERVPRGLEAGSKGAVAVEHAVATLEVRRFAPTPFTAGGSRYEDEVDSVADDSACTGAVLAALRDASDWGETGSPFSPGVTEQAFLGLLSVTCVERAVLHPFPVVLSSAAAAVAAPAVADVVPCFARFLVETPNVCGARGDEETAGATFVEFWRSRRIWQVGGEERPQRDELAQEIRAGVLCAEQLVKGAASVQVAPNGASQQHNRVDVWAAVSACVL